MANANPVNSWDSAALVVSETVLGTVPAPAAGQAIETIALDTGLGEVGMTRGAKDRNVGRGMQSQFVEGRVKPIAWSLETSCKTRGSAGTVPKESAVLKAAGLLETAGGTVVYTLPADPINGGAFSPMSVYRVFGKSPYTQEAEQLRGGYVKSLSWSGGDKELTLKASGEGIGKNVLGYTSSVTCTIGAVSLTLTGDDIYRTDPGYYMIESEVVLLGTGVAGVYPMTRAQLGTSAAAHTAVPMRPYIPALTYLGAPISESGTTCLIDGASARILSFHVDLTTGMDALPGESGSKYVQGVKGIRYDVKAGCKVALKSDDVNWLGKAKARKTVAVQFIGAPAGAVGGQAYTFNLPQVEIEPFKIPDTANDIAMVDLSFRVRDSAAGNDAFNLILS